MKLLSMQITARNINHCVYALFLVNFACESERNDSKGSSQKMTPLVVVQEQRNVIAISFPNQVIKGKGERIDTDIAQEVERILEKCKIKVIEVNGSGTITSLEINPVPEAQLEDALKGSGLSEFVSMTYLKSP